MISEQRMKLDVKTIVIFALSVISIVFAVMVVTLSFSFKNLSDQVESNIVNIGTLQATSTLISVYENKEYGFNISFPELVKVYKMGGEKIDHSMPIAQFLASEGSSLIEFLIIEDFDASNEALELRNIYEYKVWYVHSDGPTVPVNRYYVKINSTQYLQILVSGSDGNAESNFGEQMIETLTLK